MKPHNSYQMQTRAEMILHLDQGLHLWGRFQHEGSHAAAPPSPYRHTLQTHTSALPAQPARTLPPYRMEGGCRTRPVTSVISSLTMIPNSRTYGSVLKLALLILKRRERKGTVRGGSVLLSRRRVCPKHQGFPGPAHPTLLGFPRVSPPKDGPQGRDAHQFANLFLPVGR